MPGLWRLAHERAKREAREALELSGGELMTAILVVGLYLLIVWFVVGAKESQQELELRLSLTAALFLAFPLLYLRKFLAAPAKIYDEAKITIANLNAIIAPKIELDFNESICKTTLAQGVFVHLHVYNRSALPIDNCEAILVSVTRDGKPIGYLSRKNLSWSQPRDGTPEKYGKISLAEGDRHAIDVLGAGQISGHTCFWIRIADQSGIYDTPGIYQLTIQVSGTGTKSASKTLEVEWTGDPFNVSVRALCSKGRALHHPNGDSL